MADHERHRNNAVAAIVEQSGEGAMNGRASPAGRHGRGTPAIV